LPDFEVRVTPHFEAGSLGGDELLPAMFRPRIEGLKASPLFALHG